MVVQAHSGRSRQESLPEATEAKEDSQALAFGPPRSRARRSRSPAGSSEATRPNPAYTLPAVEEAGLDHDPNPARIRPVAGEGLLVHDPNPACILQAEGEA